MRGVDPVEHFRGADVEIAQRRPGSADEQKEYREGDPGDEGDDQASTEPQPEAPIVFVHGGAGSGVQYSSVARRFVSNGYPADRIRTYEYDSSSAAAIAGSVSKRACTSVTTTWWRVDSSGIWSLATVVALEYHDNRAVQIAAYSIASLVSMSWNFGWAFSPTISGWLQVHYGFGPPFIGTITLYTVSVVMYWAFFWRRSEKTIRAAATTD